MNINRAIGRKLAAAFVVLLVIQIIVGVIVYYDITRLDAHIRLITQRVEILAGLDDFIGDLTNAWAGERGYIITGEDRFLEPYQTGLKQADHDFKKLRKLVTVAEVQRRLDTLEPLVAANQAELKETVDLRKSAGFDAARKVILTDKGKQIKDDIRRLVGEARQDEQTLIEKSSASAAAASRSIVLVIAVGGIIGAIFMLVAAGLLTRNIATPLSAISTLAKRIAAGDLSVTFPSGQRTDEVGILGQALGQMVENLRRYTADLSQAASQLGSSAAEILVATTQVASGTAQTAAAISETSTTVEGVRQAAQLSSEKAKSVSGTAQRVAQVSQTGKQAVEDTYTDINRIREQMDSIAQTVVRLSEQSQSIGGIIASVTDLADQSNLLAVNAAIEAAKAGEQGKGFAVVAQEIKSLAEQSKQATAQVRGILSEVQKATSAAVMATEQGSKAVEAGVKQSAKAGEAIRLLAETSGEATDTATQVMASSQQQVVGMAQIAIAMETINQAGAQNAGSMKQMETAAQNLHELGQKLKESVEQFKA